MILKDNIYATTTNIKSAIVKFDFKSMEIENIVIFSHINHSQYGNNWNYSIFLFILTLQKVFINIYSKDFF